MTRDAEELTLCATSRRHPWVVASSTEKVFAFAEAIGIDRERLSRSAGISSVVLRNPDAKVPFTWLLSLLQAGADLSQDPLFGFHLGIRSRIDDFGAMAYLAGRAPNLLAGWESVVPLYQRWCSGPQIVVLSHGDEATLRYALPSSDIRNRHDIEFTLAVFVSFSRALLRRPLAPRAVRLRHWIDEQEADEMSRFFGITVERQAAYDEVVFDAKDLRAPMADSRPAWVPVAAESRREQVEAALARADRPRELSLNEVARSLGMSSRSLQRALAEEGCDFRGLAREHVCARAERLLADPSITLSDAAFLVGYSEASAFIRAYTRTRGHSPRRSARSSRS